jgi:D-cysteine desulfhydrase
MKPKLPNREPFAHLPTRIERLSRLSQHLGGPKLFIKRDDQTGLALGGNKTRKLEYLTADALAQKCDHLITTGAPQSNHCRQTAAAAAHFGLGCSLVLRGEAPAKFTGNLLLDQLLGARLYWTGDRPEVEVMNEVASQLQNMGHKPYFIPLGGSNVIGATGYVVAMEEAMVQFNNMDLNFDFIIIASSSGGTQAGLVVGAKAYSYQGRILGISVDHKGEVLKTRVEALSLATASYLGLEGFSIEDIVEVNDDYLGEGYGIMGDAEREAIQLVSRLEGILLDPVYTGRAMAGLIDLIRHGKFSEGQQILFWHTGGTPALFAYADELI